MAGSHEGNIFLLGDFDESLEEYILLPLTLAIKEQIGKQGGRIDLYINSMGGFGHVVQHCIELVEIAKRNGIVVRTMVPMAAFSAGSMLAVTGTKGYRYIGEFADHLIHYGKINSLETTPQQIERFRDWKTRQFTYSLKHYQKYCNIPDLKSHMQDDGFFVPARQAIRWGMADHLMNKLVI